MDHDRDTDTSIRQTLRDFLPTLTIRGWTVVVGFILGDGITAALALGAIIPWWTPLPLTVIGIAIASFVAFHQLRVRLAIELVKARHEAGEAKRIASESDSRWAERFSSLEEVHKEKIANIDERFRQLQSENAKLRDDHDFRHSLQLNLSGYQPYFRIEVRNTSSYRTLENVRVKVLDISTDGQQAVRVGSIPFFLPTRESVRKMPAMPCEQSTPLTAKDSAVFEFLRVVESGVLLLIRAECSDVSHKDLPYARWEMTTPELPPGRYRFAVRAEARDVEPVSKTIDFWRDEAGVHYEIVPSVVPLK